MGFIGKFFGGPGPLGLDMGFWWSFGIEFLVTLAMIVIFWTCFSRFDPDKANSKDSPK